MERGGRRRGVADAAARPRAVLRPAVAPPLPCAGLRGEVLGLRALLHGHGAQHGVALLFRRMDAALPLCRPVPSPARFARRGRDGRHLPFLGSHRLRGVLQERGNSLRGTAVGGRAVLPRTADDAAAGASRGPRPGARVDRLLAVARRRARGLRAALGSGRRSLSLRPRPHPARRLPRAVGDRLRVAPRGARPLGLGRDGPVSLRSCRRTGEARREAGGRIGALGERALPGNSADSANSA